MSRRRRKRERDVTLHVVNVEPLEKAVTEWGYEHDLVPDYAPGLRVAPSSWAYLEAADGSEWFVSNDGIAYRLDTDEKATPTDIEVFGKVPEEGGSFECSPLPVTWIAVPREYVVNNLEGEINLADHVRRSGSRLEQNFRIIRAIALEGAEATPA